MKGYKPARTHFIYSFQVGTNASMFIGVMLETDYA
jgi:hypothetical protein